MRVVNNTDQNLGDLLSTAKCKIFIINLDHRKDRWVQISKHLNELNCQASTRVSGVNGLNEPKELAKKMFLIDRGNNEPTRQQMGALGCLKSHLKALKLASKIFDDMDMALILEDDCFFIEGAASILKKSLDQLPPKWQFLMLGAVYGTAPGFVTQKNHLKRVYNATAAHAYLINRQSCELLIQRIETLFESETLFPIDECFIKYQSIEPWYATHPLIAGQRSGDYSDVEGMTRVHTMASFKLGVKINLKVWLWMKIRPFLPQRISAIWQWVRGAT